MDIKFHEAKRFEQFIVLIDFDKTICDSKFPLLGEAYLFAKEVINHWYAQGIYIIINTCRTGEGQLEAEAWLLEKGFNFHKINGHHPNGLLNYGSDVRKELGLDSRKIWGHVNIDDTNIDWVLNGHPGWKSLDTSMQKIIEGLGKDNRFGLLPS